MARKIKLLPRAEKELEALSPAIQNQIINKLELLREFPELGPPMFDAFQGSLPFSRQEYVSCRLLDCSRDLIEIAYIRHFSRQMRLRIIRERK